MIEEIAKSIDGVLWEADEQRREYKYISSKVEDILGYSSEEWLSSDGFWYSQIHPDDKAFCSLDFSDDEVLKKKSHKLEYRLLHKSGHYVWVQDRVTIIDINGHLVQRGVFFDITQLKEDQFAMAAETSLIERLIKDAPNAVFLINKFGDFIHWNDKFTLISGYTSSEISKMKAFDFYSSEDTSVIKENIEFVIESGDIEFEIFIVAKSNERIPVFIKATRFIFEGEVLILGIAIEIIDRVNFELERKQIAERLELSERRYKALVQEGADMTAIVDYEGVYSLVSSNYAFFTGYSAVDLIGKNAFDFIHENDRELTFHEFNKLKTNKRTESSPYRFRRKDGTYCWIRSIGTNLLDDEAVSGIVINSLDITDLIEAQRELKKNIERFVHVIDATNDAIWDWDYETNELYWSNGFFQLFGIDYSQPSFESWSKQIHPEDLDRVMSALDKVIESNDLNNWSYEYRFKKADGSFADVMDRGKVVRNDAGEILRLVGAISDITQRKNNDRFIRDIHTRLENKIQELDELNEELEQFAYVASHDLQEPLRMITSFLMQLSKKYENELDEKARLYINFAVDGAQRMNVIILDLLEYSRSGRIEELPKQSIDFNNILNDVKVMLNAAITEKNAQILSDHLPTATFPITPIRQVFQNIISNGLKYAKMDENPVITIRYECQQNFHVIRFHDNGIGIDKAYHQRIFEIFQRLHTRDEYSGTGIGLAVTKKIMQKLGGDVTVESELGKGSVFTIKLPVDDQE